MDNNMTNQFSQEDIQATKGLACLSYLGLLFLIPMLVNKDSPFTKYHVNQGIVLFIMELAFGVVNFVLSFVPIIGGLISFVVSVLFMVLSILGIVNAAQGQAKPLPVIGEIQIYK